MFIFDRCRRSSAAVAPVEYECYWNYLTGAFTRSKILLTEKLTNGGLVTPTPEAKDGCHHCVCPLHYPLISPEAAAESKYIGAAGTRLSYVSFPLALFDRIWNCCNSTYDISIGANIPAIKLFISYDCAIWDKSIPGKGISQDTVSRIDMVFMIVPLSGLYSIFQLIYWVTDTGM